MNEVKQQVYIYIWRDTKDSKFAEQAAEHNDKEKIQHFGAAAANGAGRD